MVSFLIAAQLFDVRPADKNPKKTRRESRPSGEQCAERRGEQRRQSFRMLPRAHESDELQNHDQRPRRCFGETESVHHLTRLQPAVMKQRLLRDIGQHGVGAAESHDGRFAEK